MRRWGLRLRRFEVADLVFIMRFAMSERERDVLGAMIARELHRRDRLRPWGLRPWGITDFDDD